MVVATTRRRRMMGGSSASGWKGWIWLAYLFSSAILAFNMYLMATWDITNAAQLTHASPCNINKNDQNAEHQPIISSAFTTSEHYPFKVAICVLMKDAENYFEEWLDYHFALGFDAIYIYDNSPSFELKNWHDNTRKQPTFRKVDVIHWMDDTVENQNNAYYDCVERFGRSKTGPMNDYFAFIDVDEFLVIRSPKYHNIQGILADYLVPYGGALTVNWMMVGSSNKSVSSPLPITKRNQYRAKETHTVIKSFAKTSDYIDHINPHGVNVRSPATIHTTKYPGALFKPASSTAASDHERPSDILLLYHYRYGSKKEYVFKRCVRGDAIGGNMWCDDGNEIRAEGTPEHIQITPGEVFDDTAWQFLRNRVPRYRAFDEFEDFHHPVESPPRSSFLRKILGGQD